MYCATIAFLNRLTSTALMDNPPPSHTLSRCDHGTHRSGYNQEEQRRDNSIA
jgi:hypothetical protein